MSLRNFCAWSLIVCAHCCQLKPVAGTWLVPVPIQSWLKILKNLFTFCLPESCCRATLCHCKCLFQLRYAVWTSLYFILNFYWRQCTEGHLFHGWWCMPYLPTGAISACHHSMFVTAAAESNQRLSNVVSSRPTFGNSCLNRVHNIFEASHYEWNVVNAALCVRWIPLSSFFYVI